MGFPGFKLKRIQTALIMWKVTAV